MFEEWPGVVKELGAEEKKVRKSWLEAGGKGEPEV